MKTDFACSELAFDILKNFFSIFHYGCGGNVPTLASAIGSIVPYDKIDSKVVVKVHPLSLIGQVFIEASVRITEDDGWDLVLVNTLGCTSPNQEAINTAAVIRGNPELLSAISYDQFRSHQVSGTHRLVRSEPELNSFLHACEAWQVILGQEICLQLFI